MNGTNKRLTVVITTYNRQKELINQLRSLCCQGNFDSYSIFISDNCSDYNVENVINDNFPEDFCNIITVHKNKYNVGGAINIANSFQYIDTQWMWLLSDDDETHRDSLKTIFSDITSNEDVCWIKYSIAKPLPDKRINNIKTIFDTFCFDGHCCGEFVYMSNNVYNLDRIRSYIGMAPIYANTCFSQLIPCLFAIKKNKENMLTSSHYVVSERPGNISYKLSYAFINYTNLAYSQFELTNDELKSYKTLMRQSSCLLAKSLFEINNAKQRMGLFYRYWLFYSSFRSRAGLLLHYVKNIIKYV